MKRPYKKRLNEESNNISLSNLHWKAIAIGVSVGVGIAYCIGVLFKLL